MSIRRCCSARPKQQETFGWVTRSEPKGVHYEDKTDARLDVVLEAAARDFNLPGRLVNKLGFGALHRDGTMAYSIRAVKISLNHSYQHASFLWAEANQSCAGVDCHDFERSRLSRPQEGLLAPELLGDC